MSSNRDTHDPTAGEIDFGVDANEPAVDDKDLRVDESRFADELIPRHVDLKDVRGGWIGFETHVILALDDWKGSRVCDNEFRGRGDGFRVRDSAFADRSIIPADDLSDSNVC